MCQSMRIRGLLLDRRGSKRVSKLRRGRSDQVGAIPRVGRRWSDVSDGESGGKAAASDDGRPRAEVAGDARSARNEDFRDGQIKLAAINRGLNVLCKWVDCCVTLWNRFVIGYTCEATKLKSDSLAAQFDILINDIERVRREHTK